MDGFDEPQMIWTEDDSQPDMPVATVQSQELRLIITIGILFCVMVTVLALFARLLREEDEEEEVPPAPTPIMKSKRRVVRRTVPASVRVPVEREEHVAEQKPAVADTAVVVESPVSTQETIETEGESDV